MWFRHVGFAALRSMVVRQDVHWWVNLEQSKITNIPHFHSYLLGTAPFSQLTNEGEAPLKQTNRLCRRGVGTLLFTRCLQCLLIPILDALPSILHMRQQYLVIVACLYWVKIESLKGKPSFHSFLWLRRPSPDMFSLNLKAFKAKHQSWHNLKRFLHVSMSLYQSLPMSLVGVCVEETQLSKEKSELHVQWSAKARFPVFSFLSLFLLSPLMPCLQKHLKTSDHQSCLRVAVTEDWVTASFLRVLQCWTVEDSSENWVSW